MQNNVLFKAISRHFVVSTLESFTLNKSIYCYSDFVPQAVFLADFKQIKKIQCLPQSDDKALLNIDIEGAKQVSAARSLLDGDSEPARFMS